MATALKDTLEEVPTMSRRSKHCFTRSSRRTGALGWSGAVRTGGVAGGVEGSMVGNPCCGTLRSEGGTSQNGEFGGFDSPFKGAVVPSHREGVFRIFCLFVGRPQFLFPKLPIHKCLDGIHRQTTTVVSQERPDPATAGAGEQPQFPLTGPALEELKHRLGVVAVEPLGFGHGRIIPDARHFRFKEELFSRGSK